MDCYCLVLKRFYGVDCDPKSRLPDRARLRLAAAKGLLKLAATPQFFPVISPPAFCLLASTMQVGAAMGKGQEKAG